MPEVRQSASRRATIDDLYNTPGKVELVDGALILVPPTGTDPGTAAAEILVSLHAYAKRVGRVNHLCAHLQVTAHATTASRGDMLCDLRANNLTLGLA